MCIFVGVGKIASNHNAISLYIYIYIYIEGDILLLVLFIITIYVLKIVVKYYIFMREMPVRLTSDARTASTARH